MKKHFLFLLSFLVLHSAYGQVQNIVIDSVGRPQEPTIAIDPKNPLHMSAGANSDFVYTSLDGGWTWYKDTLTSTYGVFCDPVIVADTGGAFCYFHLSINPAITIWPMWSDRIVCQRADDIGTGTWTNGGYTQPTDTPAMSDKPGVALDRNSNALYVTWTNFDRYGSTIASDSSHIFFSSSDDRGDTWTAPVRLNRDGGNCIDEDPTVEGAVPCVGPEGQVYVSWAAYNCIMFDKSYDGGDTWRRNDIFVTSTAGWDYQIPGLNRCNGLPFSACDVSYGPFRGNIYINWSDQRNGTNNTDIWISRSTDQGDTWESPKRVNDDVGIHHQFMSSMTVDPVNGHIYILFYDRRNYASNSLQTDVYMAVSKDGGETFENFKISESAFAPSSSVFFGDYTYVAAFNNVVRPIWGRMDGGGAQKIMTAIIDSTVIGTGIAPLATPDYRLNVYPNPFAAKATVSYTLPESDVVSLSITDISGRQVAVIKSNDEEKSGTHSQQIDVASQSLAPGLYFMTLRTPTYTQTMKIVVAVPR